MAGLITEDRPVKIVLGREMLENRRFRHAGRLGYLPGSGPAEAVLRKQIDRDLYDLLPPFVARHLAFRLTSEYIFDQKFLLFRAPVSKCLLTGVIFYFTVRAKKLSRTYL